MNGRANFAPCRICVICHRCGEPELLNIFTPPRCLEEPELVAGMGSKAVFENGQFYAISFRLFLPEGM